MDILAICPAHHATGGTEAIHEFVFYMNTYEGVNARIWYWNVSGINPQPDEFADYQCEYVTEIPADFAGVLVFPEIWANCALDYPEYVRAVWWLGVDAYAEWTRDRGAFLRDESIIHIAQSNYAHHFLEQLRVKNLYRCVDLLNAEFYKPYPDRERSDIVLYNPTKATPFTHRIMSACTDIVFKPITGMTRAEVAETMRGSKLYIDFGEFPGRERMPREAALCGCCIITSKIGSAGYSMDFAHDYKFESKDGHIWAIVKQIRYVLDHYDECIDDFDLFRESLFDDRVWRKHEQHKQLIGVFHEVLNNHTGLQ